MTYDEYRQRIIDAQAQWNKDRDSIYAATSVLNSVFHGEVEPPTIQGTESYDTMKLPEMVAVVDQMRPAQVLQVAEAWSKISLSLSNAVTTFNQAFSRTLESGWSGASAGAALSAVKNYDEQSRPLATSTMLVSDKLREMYTGLQQTQALMPRVSQRPDLNGKSLPKDGAMKEGDYTDEEAENEGHRILNTIYGPVAHQTDRGVPVLPAAPQIANGPAPQPDSTPGPSSPGPQHPSNSGDQASSPTQEKPGTDKPSNDNPNDVPGQPSTQTAGATPDSTKPVNTNSQPTASNQPNQPSATPNNTSNPASPTLSNAGTPSRSGQPTGTGTPKATRAPGTPGTPKAPKAPGTPKTPGAPGRSVPGTQQPQTAAPTTNASRSAPSRPGGPGLGGMPGGGQGKQEDREKSGVPDYLITKEHGEELTGLDSTLSVPPVIGGDYADG